MFSLLSGYYKNSLLRRDLNFFENWLYKSIEAIETSFKDLGFGLVPSFHEEEKNSV